MAAQTLQHLIIVLENLLLSLIVGFLLCFADEEGAFFLLTHLFDTILPDKFFQGGAKGIIRDLYQTII